MKKWVLVAGLVVGAVLIVSPASAAWSKLCDASGACVTASETETDLGLVAVGVKTDPGSEASVTVQLPNLDAVDRVDWVIPGISDVHYVPNVQCPTSLSKCHFVGPLGAAGVSEMKRGEKLILSFVDASGLDQRYEVSLMGFTAAFDGVGQILPALEDTELQQMQEQIAEQTQYLESLAQEGQAMSGGVAPPKTKHKAASSSTEQELAAALDRVQQLEAELAAQSVGPQSAAAFTTQRWVKLCPDGSCAVLNWSVASNERSLSISVALDVQQVVLTGPWIAESSEVSWKMSDSTTAPKAVACGAVGCTISGEQAADLEAALLAPAENDVLEFHFVVASEAIVAYVPLKGLVEARDGSQLSDDEFGQYVDAFLEETCPFMGKEC